LCKPYGAIGHVLGDNFGNMGTWGTSWEHIRNMMGTREKRKIFLLLFLSKKKKTGPVMSPC
jgi:hypothetical protein